MSAEGAAVRNDVWSFWLRMGSSASPPGSVALTEPAWAGSAIASIPRVTRPPPSNRRVNLPLSMQVLLRSERPTSGEEPVASISEDDYVQLGPVCRHFFPPPTAPPARRPPERLMYRTPRH